MNMDLRVLWRVTGCLLMSLLLIAAAPPAAQGEKVTVVKSRNIEAYDRALEGFRQAYSAPFDVVSLENGADPGALGQSDLLVAVGRKALKYCISKSPSHIPVVVMMTLNVDKAAFGARSYVVIEPMIPLEKQIRFVQDNFPGFMPTGVITGRNDVYSQLKKLKQKHKIEVERIGKASEVPRAYPKLISRSSSVILYPDSKVLTKDTAGFVFLKSLEAGKPLVVFSEGLVRKGAFMGLVAGNEDIGKAAARIVQKGASGVLGRQEFLPVTNMEIIINGNTAKTLGIAIPSSVKIRARVIS